MNSEPFTQTQTATWIFRSRAGVFGLALVVSVFISGKSFATSQAPLPGMVNSDGGMIPFVTWLDSVWADHLVARASTIYGSPALAEAFYRDALRIVPNSPQIVEMLAELYRRQNLTPMNHALSMYGQILDPDRSTWNEILESMPAHDTLAVSGKDGLDYEIPLSKKDAREYQSFKELIAAGEGMRGELILRGLINKHPGNLRFLVDLGILYAQQSEWGMAAAIFSYAHKIYPPHFSTTFNLCMALNKIGLSEQALVILQDQLSQNPYDPKLLKATCIQTIAMGRNDDAIELSKRWISADPNDPEAHNSFAQVLINIRRLDDADARLAISVKVEPHRTDTLLLKIQADIYRGRFEEARKGLVALAADVNAAEIQQLIKLEPYNLIPDIEATMGHAEKPGASP